jgi:hypothetical protein
LQQSTFATETFAKLNEKILSSLMENNGKTELKMRTQMTMSVRSE